MDVTIGLNVTSATGPGVAVSFPVTGIRIGLAGLGTKFATICLARATAVLFISTRDRSCVLRAFKSMAVGGVGSNPAMTNTIQDMPAQITSAAKA